MLMLMLRLLLVVDVVVVFVAVAFAVAVCRRSLPLSLADFTILDAFSTLPKLGFYFFI